MVGKLDQTVSSDESVFMDIMSRLPVKSICKFKAVCKSWNGFISEEYFATKQFAFSRENPTLISCPRLDTSMELYSTNPESFEVRKLNTIDPADKSQEYRMCMISSFNGLICCTTLLTDDKYVEDGYCDLQIWVCNPCTGESLLLPQGTPSYAIAPGVGVAYASDVNDYRVFRIFSTETRTPYRSYELECEVYSSKTGTWKNTGPAPRYPLRAYYSATKSSHVFVDGKIYWLASLDGKGEIISVDSEGTFEVISLPPANEITEDTYLMVREGKVSVVILRIDLMDVWSWEVENDEWINVVKAYNVPFEMYETVHAMTAVKNEILCVTEMRWWSYNVDTGIWNDVVAPPSSEVWYPCVLPFTESLLTCE